MLSWPVWRRLQLRVGRMTADFEFPRRLNLFNLPPSANFMEMLRHAPYSKRRTDQNYLLQNQKRGCD